MWQASTAALLTNAILFCLETRLSMCILFSISLCLCQSLTYYLILCVCFSVYFFFCQNFRFSIWNTCTRMKTQCLNCRQTHCFYSSSQMRYILFLLLRIWWTMHQKIVINDRKRWESERRKVIWMCKQLCNWLDSKIMN